MAKSGNITADSKQTYQGDTFAIHERSEHYDLLFKLITLGDVNSGKTSLIQQYIEEKVTPEKVEKP